MLRCPNCGANLSGSKYGGWSGTKWGGWDNWGNNGWGPGWNWNKFGFENYGYMKYGWGWRPEISVDDD